MSIRSLTLLLALSSGVAACRGSTDPSGGNQPPVREQLPRALTSAERQVVNSGNAFTFALFREVSATEANANVFISPMSASFSLGMTLNGARGATFDGMRQALQFGTTSQTDINAGYRGLIDLLGSLDPAVSLTVANSIWYRNTFAASPAFTEAARTFFDARVDALDFNNAAASLATINSWVNDKTKGKITAILNEIRPDDVMFLVNAIHFKGNWRTRFDPSKTRPGTFTPATGSAQQAQMMNLFDNVSVAGVGGATAVDLPYGNAAWSMTLVLPPEGTSLDAYVATLDEARWDALVGPLHQTRIDLHLPRLKMDYKILLNPQLTALGMGLAFSDFADFSGFQAAGGGGLNLSFVLQKAYVDINEEGTEAAAVTVTGVQTVSMPPSIRFDRPYLFAIRERLTGTILFIGKINRMPAA
jgi:serpin B